VINASPLCNLKRGFCILQALDKESYIKALSRAVYEFQGRSLRVSEFLTGDQYIEMCSEEDSRKVVVKKVPTQVDSNSFTNCMENFFGKIRRMYRFEPSSAYANTITTVKYASFSVEFETKESAEKAVLTGKILLCGYDLPIIIEGFKRKKNVHLKTISIQLQPLPARKPTYSSNYTIVAPLKSRINDCWTNEAFDESNQRLPKKPASFDILHNERPTSSIYHCYRKVLQPRADTDEAINFNFTHNLQLRFNIMKRDF
jgi:hypothetical protein